MTRIALLTDDHFGCRNDNVIFADNLDMFYKEVFWPWFDANQDVREIMYLGDMFDRRKYVSFQTAFRLRRSFTDQFVAREFTRTNLMLTIILGNHDLPFKHKLIPNGPYEMMPRIMQIRVITRPSEIIFNGRKFLMLPWICDANREESLQFIKETEATAVLGHLEFVGAMMNKKTRSERGLSASDFSRFEVVFSGHFHHKSTLKNIHYLGATREQTWADVNDPKGFHVLETETLNMEFIPNPHTVFSLVTFGQKPGLCQIKDKIVRISVPEETSPLELENFVNDVNSYRPADVKVLERKKVKDGVPQEIPFNSDMLAMLMDAAEEDAALKDLLVGMYVEARELEQNAA